MILGKYRSKKKLGKGAYGQVLLIQDEKGQLYALKLIAKKALLKQSYLQDYLQGQIDCMKSLNSPYIMKLFKTEQDQEFTYLVCEYCDGGDLLNFQAKQQGKVFGLQQATSILTQVIKGLYDLHQAGYLHRDIKPQNILVKVENKKQTFKLADFGFSKKSDQVGGTVLGTQHFMSPQIYRQEYGFEVDMWAFGVLFYFMLNMEYPFKINPHAPLQKKQADLTEAAKNFSYEKIVKDSKKKLLNNCTNQVEDLFKKVFQPKSQQRITFAKIRQHPLFSKFFPENDSASKILYGKKFQNKVQQKAKQVVNKTLSQKQDNMTVTYSTMKRKDKKHPKEKQALQRKKDQIDFLKDNAYHFMQNNQYFKPEQRYSLAYNLLKYYIVLLRQLIENLNPASLDKMYPDMNWNQFCKTKQFKDIKKQAQQDKLKNQVKFEELYASCQFSLKEIEAINPKFKAAYRREITETTFEGAFKESYRKSTHTSFNTLRALVKSSAKTGNKLNYNLTILVISHVFNHIFLDLPNVGKIFQDYFTAKNKTVQTIDYTQLREWMTRTTAGQLNSVARQIINLYFG